MKAAEIYIEDMRPWQAFIVKWVGKLVGLKGNAHIIFLDLDGDYEPTINDIKRQLEEEEANSVRNNN